MTPCVVFFWVGSWHRCMDNFLWRVTVQNAVCLFKNYSCVWTWVCMCMHALCMCAYQVCIPECGGQRTVSSRQLALSFCYMGRRDWTHVIRLGVKYWYLLNHLTGPVLPFLSAAWWAAAITPVLQRGQQKTKRVGALFPKSVVAHQLFLKCILW